MLKRDGYLNPVLLQVSGLVILIAFAIFWTVTGKESSLFVGAAIALIGLGSAGGAIVSVRQDVYQRNEDYKERVEEAKQDVKRG